MTAKTDRELLSLAAQANGQPWKWVKVPAYATEVPGILMRDQAYEVDYYPGWNPLENDGDALRLAVKLDAMIDQQAEGVFVCINAAGAYASEPYRDDKYAATRRAIVLAAAAVAAQKASAT